MFMVIDNDDNDNVNNDGDDSDNGGKKRLSDNDNDKEMMLLINGFADKQGTNLAQMVLLIRRIRISDAVAYPLN